MKESNWEEKLAPWWGNKIIPFAEGDREALETFIAAEIQAAREEGFKTGQNSAHYFRLDDETLRSQARTELISEIEAFDITRGILGEPVQNPLMHLNDFKKMLIEALLNSKKK